VQYAKLANPDGFYALVKASRIDAELNPILPVALLFIDSLGKSHTIKRLATASYFFETV
jgi:hypothetical protein